MEFPFLWPTVFVFDGCLSTVLSNVYQVSLSVICQPFGVVCPESNFTKRYLLPIACSSYLWHTLHAYGMPTMSSHALLALSMFFRRDQHAFIIVFMPLTYTICLWYGLLPLGWSLAFKLPFMPSPCFTCSPFL